MILLIDNYDSFTYNISQMLEHMGKRVKVIRNDQINVERIRSLAPSTLVISPGPGDPSQAGISVKAIKDFSSEIPIVGVCLGHQSVAVAFGGKIVGAKSIMHGKSSKIYHCNRYMFKGLPSPFQAIRYHSLAVEKDSLPDCLEITAWTEDGEIMGLKHHNYRVESVQFHPESILSVEGPNLIKNFLNGGYRD